MRPQYSLTDLFIGAWTFRPWAKPGAAGGIDPTSARYCYAVWLRHLVTLAQQGIPHPKVIVELGPGRTLGVGTAALLSGADQYVGLDAFALNDSAADASVRGELIELFRARTPIPGDDEFPGVQPRLSSYAFPAESCQPLTPQRIAAASAVAARQYHAPWINVEPSVQADLVMSQATMFVVPDPAAAYKRLASWLKPGGVMSHSLNFSSHGMTPDWNGHWTITPPIWRAKQGRQTYYYMQASHSEHIRFIEESGCSIVLDRPEIADSCGLTRRDLAKPFRHFTDSDLSIKRAVVIARKKSDDGNVQALRTSVHAAAM